MKLAILAALSLALATPAFAQQAPITNKEVEAHASICLSYMEKKLTEQEIVIGLKLDTPAKVRGFVYGCKLFLLGVEVGIASQPKVQTY